ncbi:MAG: hypothetical protein L0Z48_11115, partial [candidate division Zixibacteria bacterium]|nr:hypothetical protein [candidate division Zixibacteria bacterium]
MHKYSILAAILITIWHSYSFSQPLFAPPQNLGPKINSSGYETDPFLTVDGKKLFFVRGLGIWYSEWTDTGWTQAAILPPPINVGGSFKQSPSLSPDGQKLYFVDSERGGYNWDIWVSTWDSSQHNWGIPVNLGPPVNTPGVEYSAHLSPDGRHLYFDSEIYIPDSLNRCGTFVSEWNGTSWSEPVKFASNLGFCNGWQYPSITADSMWFYVEDGVSDGLSSFVSRWNGTAWETPIDLRPQIGGRSSSPFIIPPGDSLFFSGPDVDLGGFGNQDIFLLPRVVLGDLNLDGLLTAADVVLELNAVFAGGTFPAP